jgi:hypothetical protein
LSVDGSLATTSAQVGSRAGEVFKSQVARRTPPWLREEAPAVLILMAVAAVNVAILVFGHRTYFAAPDNTDQFWAWYQKADAVLHSGALPLWDANTLAGHSFAGESQTGVFYPLNILWLLVLGGPNGIGARRLDMLVVTHLLLASIGFYALARSFLVRRLPAVIAAVVFAYTGVVFARTTGQTAIFFGLALVPWAVFFAHRHLETGRLLFAGGAGVAIGMGVLAGHFQPPFHAALLVLLLYAFTAFRPRQSRRAELRLRVSGLITTFALAILVALPQLAYTLPYLSRAYRFTGGAAPVPPGGSVSFATFSELYSGGPESVLSLLDPQRFPVPDGNELFLGLAALAVLVAAVIAVRSSICAQMGRYRVPLMACAIVGALAMLGPWTFFPRILYELPLVAEVRELGRYSIMLHLVLCLLLAFALQAISQDWFRQDPARRQRSAQIAGTVGIFVAIDGIYLMVDHAPGSDSWFGVQMLLGGLALIVLAAGTRTARVPLIALLGLLIVGSSLQNGTRTLGQTSSPLYPPHYFARTPAITYAEGACAGHRTLVLEEALPINVGEVFRRLHTQNGHGATLHAPFFDFISSSSWTSVEQTRLLDLRCIVTRNPLSLPGYRLGFRDTAHGVTVYVDDDTSPLNTLQFRPIPVAVLKAEDRTLRYAVDLARPTTIIVSAIVYPGWHLQVDGHRVNAGSFRVGKVPVFPEVTLGPGRHTLDYSWSGWPL